MLKLTGRQIRTVPELIASPCIWLVYEVRKLSNQADFFKNIFIQIEFFRVSQIDVPLGDLSIPEGGKVTSTKVRRIRKLTSTGMFFLTTNPFIEIAV